MSEKIKAVLLDLDGTLVNTLYSLQNTMNRVMKKFGGDPITERQTMQYVGNGYHSFVKRSLQATADRMYREAEKWERKDEERAFELDQQADELMEIYDEACEEYIRLFEENCIYRAEAYPGMKEALRALRAEGMKLACVTNKSMREADKVLMHVFGEGYFDYLSADDGTHPLKPDAGVIRDVCEQLGVSPEDCVFVGDTKTDMETAKRAGMLSVGCAYGFRGKKELMENGASVCIKSASELFRAVQELSRQQNKK